MNDIIYLSSDEEDHKLVDHTSFFDDDIPKRTCQWKPVSEDLTVEDDDDCVVLDGDPYKTKVKETTLHTCEADDDILVLGQKGEIACIDFPHPRHACAKYPFNSTSHDKYCDMCHCYVCDIRAPCPHWCIGISTYNHCHANDKDQVWKNQRECTRSGTLLPPQTMLQNTWYSPVNQFGPSTMVAPRSNTYIRPGYRSEQPRTFPQNLQPRAPHQLYQNQNDRFNNGNPIPQVFSSKSLSWTPQRPSLRSTPLDVAQGFPYNPYVTPPTALQSNSQQAFGDYVSPLSRTSYGRQFSRTSAVSSGPPNPQAKQQQQQQQQQQRSVNRALSEIEDWLMDIGQHYPD
ncbi:RPM1 interacting protein 13 [Raphanus sativus]|nr:RPM1 interacting protein 13 [Raphanus sativus]